MNQYAPRTKTRSVESRLFRSFWDDGQIDLFFGVGAVGVGACWALDLIPLGAAVPALLAVFWTPVRRAVVEPRAGLVEFSDARARRGHRMLLVTLGVGIGICVLFLLLLLAATRLADTMEALNELVAALPGLLIGAMACLVAAGLGLGRFLAYAGVFALAGLGAALLGREPEVAIFIGGSTAAAAGTLLLARFLRRTSRAKAER